MSKTKTVTNKSNRGTTKVAKLKTTPTTATTERPILGQCSTANWFRAKHTRPKTLIVTLERTKNGYTVQDAVVMKYLNQHGVDAIQADARELVRDINRLGGITAR